MLVGEMVLGLYINRPSCHHLSNESPDLEFISKGKLREKKRKGWVQNRSQGYVAVVHAGKKGENFAPRKQQGKHEEPRGVFREHLHMQTALNQSNASCGSCSTSRCRFNAINSNEMPGPKAHAMTSSRPSVSRNLFITLMIVALELLP